MSTENQILLDSAERFFKETVDRNCLETADKGEFPKALWQETVNMGFPLMAVAEDQGGSGFAPSQAASVIRIAARHLAPIPLAETITANLLLARAGVTPGDESVTVAAEGTALALIKTADSYSVSGRMDNVPVQDNIDTIVAVSLCNGLPMLVRLCPQDMNGKSRVNIANEQRRSFELDAVIIKSARVSELPAVSDKALPLLILLALRSTQMVGVMQRCLLSVVDYANTREQFGRPIGRFQAIQQNISEIAGHVAAATAAADGAVECLDTLDINELELSVACAKSRCGEAATKVAAVCHQVFGAIGFTREHDLHHATRRLWAWRSECGDETFWNTRLGSFAANTEETQLWEHLTGVK